LDELVGVTPVHAAFYKVSSIYLREIGDYAAYYREALRYLVSCNWQCPAIDEQGCETPGVLTNADRKMHAVLLGFAALLGRDVYNFGELARDYFPLATLQLAHPILSALEGTPEQWLIDVLFAFNAGDLDKFNQFKPQWGEWDDIKKHQTDLENKIRLLCLMEIALARPSKERHIPFAEIARRAQIPDNEVELLVMRALSRGLVRGSIDEVNRTVSITWVQPRVLDNKQVWGISSLLSHMADLRDGGSRGRVVSGRGGHGDDREGQRERDPHQVLAVHLFFFTRDYIIVIQVRTTRGTNLPASAERAIEAVGVRGSAVSPIRR
jgi:26S proteasome regulatory subunit N9